MINVVFLFFLFLFFVLIFGTEYHVDKNDVSCSDNGDGSVSTPFCAIGKINDFNLLAGDVVQIHEGDYDESLHITKSGTKDSPIVYRSFDSQTVNILRNSYDSGTGENFGPIWIDQVDYVEIHGINVVGSTYSSQLGYGRMVRSNHVVIESCSFTECGCGSTDCSDSASKRGGFYIFESNYNTIQGNTFNLGSDIMSLIHSDYNVISNNSFTDAGHVLLTLKCSSNNVIRGNDFQNTYQKLVEIYDCETNTMTYYGNYPFAGTSAIIDSTKSNLIENKIHLHMQNTVCRTIWNY